MTEIMSVELAAAKSLCEARDDNDDWTGLKSSAERRRRQNRLHQRAWRRRQAEKKSAAPAKPIIVDTTAECPSIASPISSWATSISSAISDPKSSLEACLAIDRSSPIMPLERLKPFAYWESLSIRTRAFPLTRHQHHTPSTPTSLSDEELVLAYRRRRFPPVYTYLNPVVGRSGKLTSNNIPPVMFPLTSDHRLLVLIQLNVFRATLTNMALLSLLDRMPMECGMVLYTGDFPAPPKVLPPSLQETWLQQTTPHDPWIDMVPSPQLRDNLLSYATFVSEDDFGDDMMGGLFEGYDDLQANGMMVWGNPWEETAWEVTPGFVKKWGFLLKGCDALMKATNRYRAARDEEPLVLEL